jgi:arginyl-tRNA synthetase
MHFKQFFKTLELLGRGYASRLRHVGYGLLSLPGGKMSTREGRVVLVDEFLDEAVRAAVKEVLKRQEYSSKQVACIAEAVALGATKFAVLKVGSEKNIVFNASKVTKFEGHTGAFLQYSVVRCKGILDKAGGFKPDCSGPFNEFEENLIERLA